MEEWRDIAGYVGLYQVSNKGRIKSLDRINNYGRKVVGRIMTPKVSKERYLFVHLSKNGKGHPFRIHRLVAEAFIPCADVDKQVDHIDRNVQNNDVSNLRWVTSKENCRNKNNNIFISYNGETKSIAEWSETTGIEKGTIQSRYHNGWTAEEILNIQPKVGNRFHNLEYKRKPTYPDKTYEHKGENHTLLEWARLLGIKYQTLYSRVNRGWNIERALTERN